MPTYRYEALDARGQPVIGSMSIDSETSCVARLQSMGYQPTRVESAGLTMTATAAAAPLSTPEARLTAPPRELARMFHSLFISVRAGMDLYQALTTVAAQVHQPTLSRVLMEMASGVSQGQRFSVLMEQYRRIFSVGDVGIIRAAETGGFLPEALGSIAARYEEEDNACRRLRIWLWFLHSNVIGLFLMIPIIVWLSASIPTLNLATGIPAGVRTLVAVTLPMCTAYPAFLYWFYHWRRHPRYAVAWHRHLLRLPALGKLTHLRSRAVFTRVLQQLHSAGVSPGSAWESAAGSVPNLALAQRYAAGLPLVEASARYSAALQQVGEHPVTDVGLVVTGEASGAISDALAYLASQYEADGKIALGAAVVRGGITFSLWALIVSLIAICCMAAGYASGLMRLTQME